MEKKDFQVSSQFLKLEENNNIARTKADMSESTDTNWSMQWFSYYYFGENYRHRN